MGLREILRNYLFLELVLCVILFGVMAFLVLQVRDAQQAAFDSRLKGQLSYISLGVTNYKTVKGTSVFEDAQQQGVSWRELITEIDDQLQSGIEGSGSERTVPGFLRTDERPGLLRFDSDNPAPSDYLTCFRAVKLTAGEDGKSPVWLIAYLPMQQVNWLSSEVLSLETLETLVRSDTKQRIFCKIPEERRCIPRDRLLELLQAAKANRSVETFPVNP
ncbi:hypothetical protein Pan241w_50510 [Gimesia alba]|uniref:Uncharacterized protein n=1 Tax=Gimesia alba TaxID=2527973 RepID=A0A517RM40_9PLAN|nr:hypothetical protein [Gimesia alba]QDT44935.1 hypothetical protein Pan241w_50510 [Gimesia alba]